MPFGAVASLFGTAGSLFANSEQAGAVADGKAEANAAATSYNTDAQTQLKPYTDAGAGAVTRANALLGLGTPGDQSAAIAAFQATPGYQFARDQGLAAVDAGAASRGTLRSGNTVAAEQTFGSGLADQTFSSYYSRLNALLGTGAGAANANATNDIKTGAEIAGTDATAATGLASIYGSQGTILNNGVGNAYSSLNKLFGSK